MKLPRTFLIHLLCGSLLTLLASCTTGAATSPTVPPEEAPSTDPTPMSAPWSGQFPREVGDRLWSAGGDGENVIAHNGVLLRAGPGWLFLPPGSDEPGTLLLRARRSTGSADVAVYLLPESAGFSRDVLTEEYVRQAIRRVLAGRGSGNDDLLQVEDGAEGELVFLARRVGSAQAALLVRGVPTSRGLYLVTGAGETPRDYSDAADVIRSFELAGESLSLRLPNTGPGFFSTLGTARWLTDTRDGSLYSLPGRTVGFLTNSFATLPEVGESGSIQQVSAGAVEERLVRGPASAGSSTAYQLDLDEEGHRLVLLLPGAEPAEEEAQAVIQRTVAAYLVDRSAVLEAIR